MFDGLSLTKESFSEVFPGMSMVLNLIEQFRSIPQNLLVSTIIKVSKKSGEFHAFLLPMIFEIVYFCDNTFSAFNCVTEKIEKYHIGLCFALSDREFRCVLLNRLTWSSYFGCTECDCCGVKR
jgi:hypothetical protein